MRSQHSSRLFTEDTVTRTGPRIIGRTRSLELVLARNIPRPGDAVARSTHPG